MQLFRLLSLVISIIAVVGCNRFFPCILDTVCVCVSSHTAHGIMALIGYAGGTALVQSIVWFDLHQTSTQTYFMRLPIFGIESKMGIRMSGDGEGKKTSSATNAHALKNRTTTMTSERIRLKYRISMVIHQLLRKPILFVVPLLTF